MHSTFVTVSTHGGTPPEVEAWFRDFARREGLTLFDFEADEITAEDKRAHRRMVAAAKRQLEAEEREEERHEFERVLRLDSASPSPALSLC